jgi:hypothetical protein
MITNLYRTLPVIWTIATIVLSSCGANIVLDVTPPVEMTNTPPFTTTPTSALSTPAGIFPTDQPNSLSTQAFPSRVGFDFETDTKNWHTSEGEFKLAETSATTQFFNTGAQALQIMTDLFGGQSSEFAAKKYNDVYLHTEATGYFDSSVPDGIDRPGPYNLKDKRVSCYVYMPAGLVKQGSPPVTLQIFVKDSKFANQYGNPVDITSSNVEKWFELSLVVDNFHRADSNFDATQSNTLGIRVEVPRGSALVYEGPFYIDTCEIEYP